MGVGVAGKEGVAGTGKEKIIAVDLMAMAPIEGICSTPPSMAGVTVLTCFRFLGVRFLQGDITRQSTAKQITEHFEGSRSHAGTHGEGSLSFLAGLITLDILGRVELVVCDGAPDVIGMHDVDGMQRHVPHSPTGARSTSLPTGARPTSSFSLRIHPEPVAARCPGGNFGDLAAGRHLRGQALSRRKR